MHIYMYEYIYIYAYVFIHLSIYLTIYLFTYTYTHTQTHTYIIHSPMFKILYLWQAYFSNSSSYWIRLHWLGSAGASSGKVRHLLPLQIQTPFGTLESPSAFAISLSSNCRSLFIGADHVPWKTLIRVNTVSYVFVCVLLNLLLY